ncbi:TonB-dependent receptor [Formosa sp. Hel1_31_208]|uniref:TonB-dependent receptor n=1 Tax=Formosa sp. Hel1_31_208 TaxID=1798225 RepID=UPI000AAFCD68|nr:TonB-dependent receptor [Formosa sp. Hel1_31_208]
MLKSKQHITFIIGLLWCFFAQAQIDAEKTPIISILNEISATYKITFNYESSLLDEIKVFPLSKNLSINRKIKNLEKQTNLVFSKVSKTVYTIKKSARVCGYLRNALTEQVLAGATINSATNYVISDENGYFEIELASLNTLVSIRYLGFKNIERQARFFSSDNCEIISMFEQQEFITPIILSAYLVKGIDKSQDGSTTINYKNFTLLPGLVESDVLQTVQSLPGIMSVDETVSNINIRGGSHDQNLILWDDIKMYQSGHFFGLISSFNPQITQSATIINNGTDVSYTDGVSGSIHMQSDKNLASKFKGSFGINLLNADVFADVPLGEVSSVQIAARKSTDDIVRTPTYDTYFDRITQETEAQNNIADVSNSNQEFSFYDTSFRWLYNPSNKDFLRLNFILINNDLTFDETATVNGSLETRTSSVSQNSIAAGLNYKRKWNEAFQTILNIYNTDYKLQAINANIFAGQRFLQENIVSETGAKLEALYSQNIWQYKLGYNFIESEVINLNDIDLPRFVRRDSEVLREHALFGQALFQNEKEDLYVKAGARINYIETFNEIIIEPRLNIRKTIGNNFEVEILGEFKHQNMSQIVNFQNDFLGIEKRRWQLSDNDSIPIIQSKQASLGLLYKNKGWLLDAKAYFKNVDGITTQSQSFTTKYEFQKEKGSYDVYGFEFLLRKKTKHLSSWLSYSYIKNNYTFEALQEIEFPSNFDITHSITFGSTYSNDYWNISAGLNYRTGKPTTIPLLGSEVINDNVNFDVVNNQRLQDYLRIDASALYKFKISNTFRSEVGASIWNISNKENPINNYYRVINDHPVKFSRFSLGVTTNVIFRVFF